MGTQLLEILPFAAGVAVSPLSITTILLMLLSSRAASTGPAFLLGWVAGSAGLCTAVVLRVDRTVEDGGGPAPGWQAPVMIALGGLLLLAAGGRWRLRSANGRDPLTPVWLRTVDRISPVQAFVLAMVIAAAAPKNFAMTTAASVNTAQAQLPVLATFVVLTVFVIVGGVGILVPVSLYLVRGPAAQERLAVWRGFLIAHNPTIIPVAFAVIGLVLVTRGMLAV